MSAKIKRPFVKRVHVLPQSASASPSSAPQTLDDRVSITSQDPIERLDAQAKLAGKRPATEADSPRCSPSMDFAINPETDQIERLQELNESMRRAKDGKIVGWILEKSHELYAVVLADGSRNEYYAGSLPSWMIALYNAGVGIKGREFSENEQEAVVGEENEVAEVLMHRAGSQYLVRYKGFSMTEAEWLPQDALTNCKGLIISYTEELRKGKDWGSMRPTRMWIATQGTGARTGNKTQKMASRRSRISSNPTFAKHPSRMRKQLDSLLYEQTCLFDAIDSEHPEVLPKVAARELRTATKGEWEQAGARLQFVLEKYRAGLRIAERLNAADCTVTLKELLAPFSSGVVFVLYATQLENHCGLLRNGKVSPYVVNRHTRARQKTDDEFYIDFQRDFRSALEARPTKVFVFSLQPSAHAEVLPSNK